MAYSEKETENNTPFLITKIKINSKGYSYNGLSDLVIDNLSKINIFVGPNNSGKSRFIRSLASDTDFKYDYNLISIENLNNFIRNILKKIEEFRKDNKINWGNNIKNDINEITMFTNPSDVLKKINDLKDSINRLCENTNSSWGNLRFSQVGKIILEYFNEEEESFGKDYLNNMPDMKFKKVYVPILRGLKPLYSEEDLDFQKMTFNYKDLFGARTMNDYFSEQAKNSSFLDTFEVFTGLTLYEDIKNKLLGREKDRNHVKNFENFLSNAFFNGDQVTLIPNPDTNVLLVSIGSEEYPIYDLGDGMQNIIVTLYPCFKYEDDNVLLFIEEPELTMHPGLQRKFIRALADNFNNVQVFLTTHSNHLLDITLDYEDNISIFAFNKYDYEKFLIRNVTPNKDILDLIGVRSSSVFLSNCVIWVEGITDRLYLKKMLALYQDYLYIKSSKKERNSYEEDKHYSIVEYSGDNVTHYNFDIENDGLNHQINVGSISKNNFIIADNDGYKDYKKKVKADAPEKLKRLNQLHNKFKETFYAEHREIENLLPISVYMKFFEQKDYSLTAYEYNENLINNSEIKGDIETLNIGDFLKKHFIELKKGKTSKNFLNKDITCIGNKKDIAINLIQIMNSIDLKFKDLPVLAQNLIQKLYVFIENNNK